MVGRPKGTPKTGGRVKGSKDKATLKREKEIAASGLTPLQYLLSILRDDKATTEARTDAAKAAAPYVHPRLAAVELSGGLAITHEDALEQLERSRG